MVDKISTVILAAGKGTRLKMDVPKPLVPLEKRLLVDYVIDSVKGIGDITLVTGHGKEQVETHVLENHKDINVNFAFQKEQLGTGHAVRTYFEENKNAEDYDYTIVACADTPLLTSEIILELKEKIIEKKLDALVASFKEDNPTGYGRVIKAEKGLSIIEEKDASDAQKAVQEVNSGLYIFKTEYLKSHVFGLDNNNNSGEFYLTDTFKDGANVEALFFEDKNYFLGINNLVQLNVVERKFRNRLMKELLLDGVRIIDMSHTYIYSKEVGLGSIIYPNVHIDSHSKIGKNVTIEPGCIINNSVIEDNVTLKAYTYITDSHVKSAAKVGPMAQLRPGSVIGENSKLGNFVEVKKSVIESNTSVSHLSYVGDAQIGSNVNIGCGFITCNYDGANKHITKIGDGSFIGSDCQMIAPIEIGENAYVGSGSTVNKNVPDGAFAIARARQETKEGMARRFIKKKEPKN